jgi:hypothetical protein
MEGLPQYLSTVPPRALKDEDEVHRAFREFLGHRRRLISVQLAVQIERFQVVSRTGGSSLPKHVIWQSFHFPIDTNPCHLK